MSTGYSSTRAETHNRRLLLLIDLLRAVGIKTEEVEDGSFTHDPDLWCETLGCYLDLKTRYKNVKRNSMSIESNCVDRWRELEETKKLQTLVIITPDDDPETWKILNFQRLNQEWHYTKYGYDPIPPTGKGSNDYFYLFHLPEEMDMVKWLNNPTLNCG